MQGMPPAVRAAAAALNNPLARPNDYSYGTQPWHKRVVQRDSKTNVRMVNHPILKDDLTRYPEVDDYCLSIRVGRNMPGAPNLEWLHLNGKLNANKCTIGTHICEIGTVRMMSTAAELVYEDGVSYWRWTHEILMTDDPKAWMFKADSHGVNAMFEPKDKNGAVIVGGALVKRRIVDEDPTLSGNQVLTVDGKVFAKNQSDTINTVEYNYIDFGTFPTVL
jgi:hypothetical protein